MDNPEQPKNPSSSQSTPANVLYPELLEDRKKTLEDLLVLMNALRTPGTGCPWDLEQNFASIAPYTIEEAYEVADAIARKDLADLRDELGDLLLQVVYHAQMADEQSAFDFADVTDAITRKMIRRHPHVFGDAEARTTGDVKGQWDRIKAEERADKDALEETLSDNKKDKPAPAHTTTRLLKDVPVGLPGLTRAIKLQKRAAKVGFDWSTLAPVLDKMKEELGELDEAITKGDQHKVEEEFGDLLFVMANVARHLDIEPEGALRKANEKFIRRFSYIEETLLARGTTPGNSTLVEMDALWDEAKRKERM